MADTSNGAGAFLAAIEDTRKRADCAALVELMSRLTGAGPALWRGGIIGFGRYHYRYASGHEGDTCLIGFSPRKAEFSIYLSGEIADPERRAALLAQLGRHRMGKGCLYVKRLGDIDMTVLETLARESIAYLRATYPDHE
jgi:hypothetical protein